MLFADYRRAVMADLFDQVLVAFGRFMADARHNHGNDARTKGDTYENQQQFHAVTLMHCDPNTSPATDGRCVPPEMATDCSNAPGFSAHIPLSRVSALMEASDMEDSSWTIVPAPAPTAQARLDSAFWLLPLLLFWSCSTRFLREERAARPLTLLHSARPMTAHLPFKKQHQPRLQLQLSANNSHTTHSNTATGGRSHASACGAFWIAQHSPKIEASSC